MSVLPARTAVAVFLAFAFSYFFSALLRAITAASTGAEATLASPGAPASITRPAPSATCALAASGGLDAVRDRFFTATPIASAIIAETKIAPNARYKPRRPDRTAGATPVSRGKNVGAWGRGSL